MEKLEAYGIADGIAPPYELVLRIEVRELCKTGLIKKNKRISERQNKWDHALDNEFVDALGFKSIRNGLGDEDTEHHRHRVRERIRQLEHYHRQRNRSPGDAGQCSRRSYHRIQSRDNALNIFSAR